MSRILDPDFRYTSSAATSVLDTWKKHGFRPTTQTERNARVRRQMNAAPQAPREREQGGQLPTPAAAAPNVRQFKKAKKCLVG